MRYTLVSTTQPKIDGNRLSMSEMQISIRFGRKSSHNPTTVSAFSQIFVNYVGDKVLKQLSPIC